MSKKRLSKDWQATGEKPQGIFCYRKWINTKHSCWYIVEQGSESAGPLTYSVLSTTGSCLPDRYQSLYEATQAFEQFWAT